MKHDWDYAPELNEGRFANLSTYGVRRCRTCMVVQKKYSQHLWMRVVGYHRYPLAGRCRGNVQRNTKGRTP